MNRASVDLVMALRALKLDIGRTLLGFGRVNAKKRDQTALTGYRSFVNRVKNATFSKPLKFKTHRELIIMQAIEKPFLVV